MSRARRRPALAPAGFDIPEPTSSALALDEHRLANELRDAWLSRRLVRLTLTPLCMVPSIIGRVSSVAVTGAFATVDGWHVPLHVVRGVGKPTHDDIEAYAGLMRQMRREADGA